MESSRSGFSKRSTFGALDCVWGCGPGCRAMVFPAVQEVNARGGRLKKAGGGVYRSFCNLKVAKRPQRSGAGFLQKLKTRARRIRMTPDPEQRLPRELLKELIEEGSDAFRGVLEKLLIHRHADGREEFLGARRWERSDQRRDHANGYKAKTLSTRVGQLQIRIPQVRHLDFYRRSLERGCRSEKALKLAIAEMYVMGVSTRKVTEITRAAVRHRNLRQPGLKNLQAAGRRTRAVSQPPFGQLSSCVPGCPLREGPSPGQHSGCGRLESDRSQLLGQAGGDWGQLPTQRGGGPLARVSQPSKA